MLLLFIHPTHRNYRNSADQASLIILSSATMKRVESNEGIILPNSMLHYKYIMITLVILMVSTLLVAVYALATNYKYMNEMAELKAQNQYNSDMVRAKQFSCNTCYTSGHYHNETTFCLNETCRHLDTLTKAVYQGTQQY